MDLVVALALSFACLLVSVVKGYCIAYPLFVALAIIGLTLAARGFSARALLTMGVRGSQKSFSVLSILLLIGIVTAVWMAAGTVPAIVYYGIQLINPHAFILAAFILTSLVSLLIGTSFGAVSTIGVALMIMAKGSAVDPHIIAGAVIAGAYFGDRCSPMSSSANLIAAITRTDLYVNLKNMLVTGVAPLLVACLLYAGLSVFYPVQTTESGLTDELGRLFNLHWTVFLPAIVLIILAILRVDVKRSMISSIAVGVVIALWVQHVSPEQVLRYAIFGFSLDENTAVRSILLGGGILSMVQICIIVILSTAIAGMLAGTDALRLIETGLKSVRSRSTLFLSTALIGTAAAAFGCTQTIAILLTQELVKTKYSQLHLENTELALDLENTVVIIAPLLPWNIAGLVPATILMSDLRFIPFACYLYLIPILVWMHYASVSNRSKLGKLFSQRDSKRFRR